jgi:hypothetical protein
MTYTLRFALTFEESGEGSTRITQRVTLGGERADDYAECMKMIEQSMPEGMRRLSETIVKTSGEAG